jgi:hypothetical protein
MRFKYFLEPVMLVFIFSQLDAGRRLARRALPGRRALAVAKEGKGVRFDAGPPEA